MRLTAGGHTVTQPLRLELDPRSTAATTDLEAQLAFALEQRDRNVARRDADPRGGREVERAEAMEATFRCILAKRHTQRGDSPPVFDDD